MRFPSSMLVYCFGALLIQACLDSHVIETKLPGVTEVLDLGGDTITTILLNQGNS